MLLSLRTSFYNLVTDFYEYGWGQSFHFAPRQKRETFRESIRRAEYTLASRLEVRGQLIAREAFHCITDRTLSHRNTPNSEDRSFYTRVYKIYHNLWSAKSRGPFRHKIWQKTFTAILNRFTSGFLQQEKFCQQLVLPPTISYSRTCKIGGWFVYGRETVAKDQ